VEYQYYAKCVIEFEQICILDEGDEGVETPILTDEIEAALATKPLCDMVTKYEVDEPAGKVRYWLKHPRHAKKAERLLFRISCFTE